MEYRELHAWDLTYQQARELQTELRKKLIFRAPERDFQIVAGADVAYDKPTQRVFAAIVTVDLGIMKVLEEACAFARGKFPYIPGLLTFREAPTLLEAWKRLSVRPEVLICDGQGYAHPRRFGLACHVGMLVDLPTIGCAKTRLIGEYESPRLRRGEFSPLREGGEQIGAVLRTQDRVKPLFISQGYKISLDQALEVVLRAARRYRLPEPVRLAHQRVSRMKREFSRNPKL
ncbi:MAG: deoxyribonuclease V [Acidobacteria bacterium]|nr:deoxyribonuclease V [Acidobacteriota bacterium]